MWRPRLGNAPFLVDLFAPAYPQANIVELALPDYERRCHIMDVAGVEAADFVYPDADIPTLILSGAMDPAHAAAICRSCRRRAENCVRVHAAGCG